MTTPIPAVALESYATPGAAAFVKIYGPVPDDEEHSVAIRAVCLSTTAADTVTVQTERGGVVTGIRCNNHLIGVGSGTFDVDTALTLNAGAEIWARSGGGNIGLSVTATLRQIQ